MRDAGLSIKTWMDINDNDYNTCREVLEAYLGWVGKVQQKNDPNGNNIGHSLLLGLVEIKQFLTSYLL